MIVMVMVIVIECKVLGVVVVDLCGLSVSLFAFWPWWLGGIDMPS
jgi:hypothetical protein